jgi:hypothetical protein
MYQYYAVETAEALRRLRAMGVRVFNATDAVPDK